MFSATGTAANGRAVSLGLAGSFSNARIPHAGYDGQQYLLAAMQRQGGSPRLAALAEGHILRACL
jgi:hypothetical protein